MYARIILKIKISRADPQYRNMAALQIRCFFLKNERPFAINWIPESTFLPLEIERRFRYEKSTYHAVPGHEERAGCKRDSFCRS